MFRVQGGELFDHIVLRGYYSEKHACLIISQLCEAVSFMHKHGVAHRDLKVTIPKYSFSISHNNSQPQNLLCTPDGMTIKIAGNKLSIEIPPTYSSVDFGLSKMYANGEELKTACGTPDYVGN